MDVRRIGNDGRQRKRSLLESLGAGNARAANPDIGSVPKVFPGHA